MTTLTEGRHPGEFIMTEGNGNISREALSIAMDKAIEPNMVLGKRAIVANVVTAAAANAGNTGSSGALTLANPAVSTKVKDGVYTLTCIEPATDAGKFEVADPDGKVIGIATVGVAFTGDVKFTIADATDFVAGDGFKITVSADGVDFEYAPFDPTATDGLEVPAAISIYGIVTAEDARASVAGIVRLATVNGNCLVWSAAISDANKANGIQALAAQNIIVR